MPNLTLLLLTHNDSTNIKDHFTWLDKCPGLNEIIIIDDNSSDDSIKEATKLKSKIRTVEIYKRGLDHNFSAQRQFGLSKAGNEWILWLDPDEEPNSEFIKFLNTFNANNFNYSFPRHDFFLGHHLKHGETSSQSFLRLFNKNFGQFNGLVHEVWQSKKPISLGLGFIKHTSHSTLKSFFSKLDFYSTIRAEELHRQHTKTNVFLIITYPTAKFFQNYFFRFGFLDGTPGIILAIGMSFHSFLVRAKLWQLSNR